MTVPEENRSTHIKPVPITVRIDTGIAAHSTFSFRRPFRIGRDQSCEIQLNEPVVSRFHAEFWYADGRWWLLDLKSHNGTFLNGSLVEKMPFRMAMSSKSVATGRKSRLTMADRKPTALPTSSTNAGRVAGPLPRGNRQRRGRPRTVMIRQAFKQVQTRSGENMRAS